MCACARASAGARASGAAACGAHGASPRHTHAAEPVPRTCTVRVTAPGAAGREHHHQCFSSWLAGGGVKSGITHGKTDEYGYFAVEDKVHVHDLHATILHLMGFDHERLTYRHGGRDYRLTDVHGHVVRPILAV